MTFEQWQQVKEVVYAALERAPEQRAAFLDDACQGDQALRGEVEALLDSYRRAGSFFETPAIEVAAGLMAGEPAGTLAGRSLSHFRVHSLLCAGGMGEVYLAEDTLLARKVALKLLPTQFTSDGARIRRFQQEARAASSLNHPNIVIVHEIGEVNGSHFIATEFIEGETLRDRLKRSPLKVSEALDVTAQVAAALVAAHGAGIVHRDIKPENVMVRPDGLVKVLDFGLAKLSETQSPPADSQSSTLARLSTAPGVVMGTVSYMSPEQVRGLKVDHRTDIFSLGVMLYEMVTGRRPFEGETTSDVIAAILQNEPSSLTAHGPNTPCELERIVSKTLRKDREERYQVAKDLLLDLKSFQPESSSAAAVRRRKRWRGPVIALAILLLVGVGAALSFFPVARQPVAPSMDIKSIAVLPPRPVQASERDEALEMGTTSILINRLGSLRQVIVRPESAVERYARPGQDPLDAGREQKVDAVLDSRYQRSGDKYRFTLSLLRVADGATLWADTLDQQAADLFAIQDALSIKVTGALRLTLSDADKELLAKRYTNSAEAWLLYFRGRHLLHQRRIPDIKKAITYFERAIALDHGFALAHVMLGYSYASLSNYGHAPPKELLPKAKAAYDQARKIDDQLAEVHSYLADYKLVYEWDYGGAEQEHRRAIDLNPNSADVHIFYALYLKDMGRFEQAIAESRRAEALDPTDMFINLGSSNILYFARRYDEAIEQASRGVDLNPNWAPGYAWMIRAYEMKGDEQRAFATYLKQAEANRVGPDEISRMKAAFAAGGLKGHWRRMLDRLLEREKSGYVQQLRVALLYARLGEKGQALARLQKAGEDRDIFVCALNVEPLWDSYRTDPRFVALVRRAGLAP